MLMAAVVLRVREDSLLVRNLRSGQEVVVFVSNPQCFSAGDRVLIRTSGIMTLSIPPQTTALFIRRIGRNCRC